MTETQTPPRPPVTIGQAVGLAEAALTRLLTGVLAETGTSRETYLAFQRLSLLGGAAAMDAYVRDLATGAPVAELTAAAAQLLGRIRGSVGRVTAELVAPFDAKDIETTIQTLQAVTERARQMRPAGQSRG